VNERTQQLAVLLNLLGEESAEQAIANFDAGTSEELQRVLAEFKTDPPTPSEIEYVLDDFDRYFTFAFQQLQQEETERQKSGVVSTDTATDVETQIESYHAKFGSIITFSKPNLTGDTKHDLNLLHPYQVAYAIRNDNPNSIAVVINSLTDAHAAQTMENLPPDIRLEVFLRMADPMEMSIEVEQQILDATLQAAMKVESRVPEVDRTGQLVALTRSLPKTVRVPLLEKLLETNQELALAVKQEMYRFEDLMKLSDQDIQKVLGQCDTDSLVLALVHADPEVKEKLLNNMSKRARQTIEEELDFKSNVREEEAQSGVKAVVAVLMRLDEGGEISLE